MVAINPSYQRHGLASALTEAATTWLRDRGAAVVMVEPVATQDTRRLARRTRASHSRLHR